MQAIKIIASSLQEGLNQASITTGVEPEKIDFDLLTYRTYYRGTIDEEWRLLENNTRLEAVTTEVEIRSSSFEVRQEYEFIFHHPQPHPYFNLRLTLAMDKYRSKAIAIIDPSSTIPLKQGIQGYIKQELHRKKLQSGLLIGITDNDFDLQINQLLLKIQTDGPLQEPYRMGITEFFPPIQPIDDAIVLHYKKNDTLLIEGVKVDDLIFEYVFASPGRSGRSCDGSHIHVDEPKIRYATAIKIDHNSIRAEEDSFSIKFYTTQSGFVEEKNGSFSIGHELRLKEASFKETGSIEAGSDKEIHVTINHNDNSKDAVGSGVNIDVQTLDVLGTVGSNTKIQACAVNIGAQTHKKSLIEVQENATIHLHRGDLKAKNATIEILEAGRVEAVTVHVGKMMGGEIIAEHVIVDTLYSNGRITALKSIEIHTIIGEGNNLIIDPMAIASYQEQIATLEDDLQTSLHYLQQKGKELLGKELSLKGQMNRIKQTQLAIKTAYDKNTQPLKTDIVRVQQFKLALSELHKEQHSIQEFEEEMRTKQHELEKLLDADIHATISHHASYNGYTRIHFIDPKTSQQYAITPQGYVSLITLRREGEDKKIVYS